MGPRLWRPEIEAEDKVQSDMPQVEGSPCHRSCSVFVFRVDTIPIVILVCAPCLNSGVCKIGEVTSPKNIGFESVIPSFSR
jgi:hypothetical protein